MADSDGGHVWPPRASDLRIQELTAGGPEASKPDNVFVALRTLGYTGSLDDMWKQHLEATGITDTSEPFTDSLAGSSGLVDLITSGYDIGTDGANVLWSLTDGTGGTGGTGLKPILDVISPVNRRFGGCSVSPDGTACVATSYDNILASFALSTPYDLSTATQTGSSKTGLSLLSGTPQFAGAGAYVTYAGASDSLHCITLATPYVVESTDTTQTSATEVQIMGYGSSADNVYHLAENGTGIWAYGRVDVSTYTLVWNPLSTPYDLTTFGTPEHNSTNYTAVPSGPSQGVIIASPDGTRLHAFAGSGADKLIQYDVAAFDPASGNTRTEDTSVDITTDYANCSWSTDFSHIYISGSFTSPGFVDIYGVL